MCGFCNATCYRDAERQSYVRRVSEHFGPTSSTGKQVKKSQNVSYP